jgi:hypothetical protein
VRWRLTRLLFVVNESARHTIAALRLGLVEADVGGSDQLIDQIILVGAISVEAGNAETRGYLQGSAGCLVGTIKSPGFAPTQADRT